MYEVVKDKLGREDLEAAEMFSVLRGISALLNNKDTYHLGRDLTIRALARRHLCGDFEKQILTSLVRIVGLYPYMRDDLKYADANDRIAYELHRSGHIEEVFNSLQARIYHQIMRGRNVVLSANTSVGKSLVVDAVIASEKHRKVVIIVPTLALIDETRKRLTRRFGDKYAIITHPTQAASADRRNIFILTQERVRQRGDLAGTNLFVIDEFYKIDIRSSEDQGRAIELNLAFHSLASSGAQFYMLGPNIQAVSGLDRYNPYFVSSNFSTVAVDVTHFNLPTRGDDRRKKLAALCREFTSPTLIYCQSVPSAARVARNLLLDADDVLPVTCQDDVTWMSENFHEEWGAAKALRRGVGLHHGGLPRSMQQHMVRLFNEGKIKYLICTSTLIEGVNTVAENVVIYDRRRGSDPLDFFTYKNIQGRAGRMGRYFVGKVFLLEKPMEEADTYVEYAVESQSLASPLSLLLRLDDKDLAPDSRDMVAEALKGRFLSEETLRSNPSVHPEIQDRIARVLQEMISVDPRTLSWSTIPNKQQLLPICEIIYDFIAKASLGRARITSGKQLNWYIRAATTKAGIPGYLRDVANGVQPGQDTTEKLDDALRILRNIVTYRFPQDLMIVSRIQSEVADRMGVKAGNYASYAENLENLFMPSVFAALEEYGIPVQMVGKIRSELGIHYELSTLLDSLRSFDVSQSSALNSYERKWIERIKEGL